MPRPSWNREYLAAIHNRRTVVRVVDFRLRDEVVLFVSGRQLDLNERDRIDQDDNLLSVVGNRTGNKAHIERITSSIDTPCRLEGSIRIEKVRLI